MLGSVLLHSDDNRRPPTLRLTLWLAIAGITLTLFSVAYEAQARAAEIATLVVEGSSGNEKAQVWVDGNPAGTTPVSVDLPTGTHTVDVTFPDGRRARTRTLSLEAGDRRTLRLAAQPVQSAARLTVRIGDPKAVVNIDGRRAGVGPVQLKLTPGEHRITIAFSSGRVFERRIVATPGAQLMLEPG